MHRCVKCEQLLPADQFRRNPDMRSGIHSWCRPCTVARTKQWRADNRDAQRARRRRDYRLNIESEKARKAAWYETVRPPLRTAFCRTCGQEFQTRYGHKVYCQPECKIWWRNHTKRGVSKSQRRAILMRDNWHCYLCDRPIPRDVAWPHPLSASVDHVVPYSVSKNDHPDNLRAAHWGCNYEKGDSLPGTEVWVPAEAA